MGVVSFSQLGKMGRLGNQMFQIAALFSYAKKHDKKFTMPVWEYSKYFKPVFLGSTITVDKTYNEPAFEYNEIPFIAEDFDLSGYFQSEKYFDNINVNELFELKPEWRKIIDDIYNSINPKGLTTCSIHVRRGDYLKEPHASYHGFLGEEYYDDAVNKLYPRSFDDILFVVCSDDQAWCKENFKGPENIHFSELYNVCTCPEDYAIIDMFLMAKCRDHIIANSSYSWWAAYLGNHKYTHTVAPLKWFAGANLNTKDLLPENWIKL